MPAMSHPLDAHALPGIGTLRRSRLAEAGVDTLEQLLSADAHELARLSGFNTSIVSRARDAAAQVLAGSGVRPSPAVIPLDDDPAAEPSPDASASPEHPAPIERVGPRLQRGLDLARRIEAALEWIWRAREHAEGVPAARPRRRLRRQLRKLVGACEDVQREAIARGASSGASADLDALIGRIEARLRAFVGSAPNGANARILRKRVRKARRELRARIT